MSIFNIESFHTVLVCRKWDACVSFYTDVLGFETVDSRAGFVEVRVSSGAHIGLIKQQKPGHPHIGLMKNLDTHSSNPGNLDENIDTHGSGNMDTHIILTFRVKDVDEIHALLKHRWKNVTGIKFHSWGARLFELSDPDGRRLEFWTPK